VKTRSRLALRWSLFFSAGSFFLYFVFIDSGSMSALGGFFVTGGLWYWRERRKMRELDAPRPR